MKFDDYCFSGDDKGVAVAADNDAVAFDCSNNMKCVTTAVA